MATIIAIAILVIFGFTQFSQSGCKCSEEPAEVVSADTPKSTLTNNAAKPDIQWVHIPGGTFSMGSKNGDKDERPVHRVTLSSFEMSKTEVTVAQYQACVNAGSCTKPETGDKYNWGASGRNEHPINGVSWNQAVNFARWVGGRLPTEAEWEYAARGGEKRYFPWGNQKANCQYAVMDDNKNTMTGGCGKDQTWTVCSKPVGNSKHGLCDMAGNVSEWVSDWYGAYPSGLANNPKGPTSGKGRVNRGGGWYDDGGDWRSAQRNWSSPKHRYPGMGFRIARSMPSAK